MEDQRIVTLIPNPPEGLLFFSWFDGEWDVNQFQFGSWNFPDQVIEPGASGLLLNPSDPFDLLWAGTQVTREVFSGFFSEVTPFRTKHVSSQARIGDNVYSYEAKEDASGFDFNERREIGSASTFLGVWIGGWSPQGDELGTDSFYFVQSSGGGGRSVPDTGRATGRDVYVNNYVPALGVNAPYGNLRCSSFIPLDEWGVNWVRSIEIKNVSGSSRFLSLITNGPNGGYFDMSKGGAFSIAGNRFAFSEDENRLLDRVGGAVTINRESGGFPAPPQIITELSPVFLGQLNLGPRCPMFLDLNPNPDDIEVIAGGRLEVFNGMCEMDGLAAFAWEENRQHIHFVWQKQDSDGNWTVLDVDNSPTLVIDMVRKEDAGVYGYSYYDDRADSDEAFTCDSDRYFEAVPFTISVSSVAEVISPSVPSEDDCSQEGGLVLFLNVAGPILNESGTPTGSEVLGQLYFGASPEVLRPLCLPLPVLQEGVIVGPEIHVPGFAGGDSVWFQLRAWKGAERFEDATIRGSSEVQSITLKSPGDLTPAPRLAMPSFQLREVSLEPMRIEIVREGEAFLLRWSGQGVLQSAERLDGTFVDVPEVSSPFKLEIIEKPQRFYRISRP
ncbi:hypothetical protein N8487_00150 [bacterium]|nr:hypothetical protein [bacterium]